MTTTSVLSYRWRTDPTHDDPNKWKPDSITWTENETLGMVRSRIIKSFNETGQHVDFARASDHTPELWRLQNNETYQHDKRVHGQALLGYRCTDAAGDEDGSWFPKTVRELAPAVIVFTFPLKADAEGNRTDTRTAVDKHIFPADDPLALNDARRLVAGSLATPPVHPTAADAAASHTTPSTDTLVEPMTTMQLGDTSSPVTVLPKDIQQWTKDHVSEWLRQNELGEHITSFRENNIRGRHLATLTDGDLKNYGVTAGGDRKDILTAIQKLTGTHQVAAGPASFDDPQNDKARYQQPAANAKRSIDNVGSWLKIVGGSVDDVDFVSAQRQLRLTSSKLPEDCFVNLTASEVRSITWSQRQKDKLRHALQEDTRQLRQRVNQTEGWNPTCIIQQSRLDELLEALLANNADGKLFVRAPPGSGRTTMAETFANYCVQQGYIVYSLTLLGFVCDKTKTGVQNADMFFLSNRGWSFGNLSVNTSFSDILQRARSLEPGAPPIVLVLDDVQKWYDPGMAAFWEEIFKNPISGLKMLFFATYGDARDAVMTGTPAQIGWCTRGLDLLRISRDDAATMAALMINRSERARSEKLVLHTRALDSLYDLAGGHVQVMREVIDMFIAKPEIFHTEDQQFDFLSTRRCFVVIGKARAFMRIDGMYDRLEQAHVDKRLVLDALLDTNHGRVSASVRDARLRKTLLEFGLFLSDEADPQRLCVMCPAVFDVLLSEHLAGTLVPREGRDSFLKFLNSTVQRMDGMRLRAALVNDTYISSTLCEQVFQREFYRAVAVTLGRESLDNEQVRHLLAIATDAGNTRAKCDFFISSFLRWGVELMCRGNYTKHEHKSNISEHVERFEDNGKYSVLRCKHMAVVDFHVASVEQDISAYDLATWLPDTAMRRALQGDIYWAVVFDHGFSKARIYAPQAEPITVILPSM